MDLNEIVLHCPSSVCVEWSALCPEHWGLQVCSEGARATSSRWWLPVLAAKVSPRQTMLCDSFELPPGPRASFTSKKPLNGGEGECVPRGFPGWGGRWDGQQGLALLLQGSLRREGCGQRGQLGEGPAPGTTVGDLRAWPGVADVPPLLLRRSGPSSGVPVVSKTHHS